MSVVEEANSSDSTAHYPLPSYYAGLAVKLRGSFPNAQAEAVARMLWEISCGAGELTARNILKDGGFSEENSRHLAKAAMIAHNSDTLDSADASDVAEMS